jgi:hypothetical protein
MHMEMKIAVENVFSVVATFAGQLDARLRRMLRLQNTARSLMVCSLIVIPLKSFSQTCGPVLWGAGNGYPPGPYSSPDAACRILNGVTGPAEGWGPNAIYTNSDAAVDGATWEGTPTGGYPGSTTYCSYTLTITGCGEDCPTVQQATGALPYVYATPPTGPCPHDLIAGCKPTPSCAQKLSRKQTDYDAFKARCNEQPPPGLSVCNLAKWKLTRNTDCRNMQQSWDDKWSSRRHADVIENLDQRIRTLEDRAAKYCKGQKP